MDRESLEIHLNKSLRRYGVSTVEDLLKDYLSGYFEHLICEYCEGVIDLATVSYGVEMSLRVADLGYVIDETRYGLIMTGHLLDHWFSPMCQGNEAMYDERLRLAYKEILSSRVQ